MITSAGVGSGIDIENIITQLMSIEREPINSLQREQLELDVKISALGTLRSSISDLESKTRAMGDRANFGAYEASSSDEDVFSVDVAPGTSVEQHSIQVTGLAQAHQLASDLYADGLDSVIQSNTYSFSSGDQNFDISIDSSNNTLLELRDAINDSVDNTSINASVLNLDGGSRLVLTAANSGSDGEITVSNLNLNEITEAQDATFTVDGFVASSSSNTVSDVIPGVTLNLKSIGAGNMETTRNTDSFKQFIDEFVSGYNSLVSSVDSLSENDLRSDGTLRNLKSDLSRIFYDPIEIKGENYSAFNLGLTFDRNGVLSIDEDVFSTISSTDTENFITAITDPEIGFSQRVESTLDKYSDAEGLLAAKSDSFETQRRNFDDQSGRLEYRLELTEARLRRQFTALDTLVSQLQATSSYLTDQLSSLNVNSDS